VAALVEAGADEANTGRLSVLGGKEAAASALLARMNEAAACSVGAAGAVDTGLGGVELGRVEGGILEPVDGHLVGSWRILCGGWYMQ